MPIWISVIKLKIDILNIKLKIDIIWSNKYQILCNIHQRYIIPWKDTFAFAMMVLSVSAKLVSILTAAQVSEVV